MSLSHTEILLGGVVLAGAIIIMRRPAPPALEEGPAEDQAAQMSEAEILAHRNIVAEGPARLHAHLRGPYEAQAYFLDRQLPYYGHDDRPQVNILTGELAGPRYAPHPQLQSLTDRGIF